MAQPIWKKEDYIGEDIDLIGILWKFEESDEFEHNLKYKMQATDYSKNGQTILRYDNANDAHIQRHHKHVKDKGTQPLENPFKDINTSNKQEVVETIFKLWKEFKQEVNQLK